MRGFLAFIFPFLVAACGVLIVDSIDWTRVPRLDAAQRDGVIMIMLLWIIIFKR